MFKSPSKSLKGFKLSKNFFNALKNALYVMVPAILTEMISHSLIGAGVASLIGPMVLKGIEFFFKEIIISN